MPAAENNRPYVVQTDIKFARRKRVHEVIDPSGLPVFHAPLLMDVLDWLTDKNVHAARFTDEESTYDISFANHAPPKPLTEG